MTIKLSEGRRMHAHRYSDKRALEEELRALALPAFIRGIKVETGVDGSGEEAYWVWFSVEEGAISHEDNQRALEQAREQVYRLFAEQVPGILPYIRIENLVKS